MGKGNVGKANIHFTVGFPYDMWTCTGNSYSKCHTIVVYTIHFVHAQRTWKQILILCII